MIICYLLSGLFIYSRFIEPQLLVVDHTKIQVGFQAKIAVVSDLHLGVYKDSNFLRRIVERLNAEPNLTAVVIPGDLTYQPDQDLTELFSPLRDLQVPVYAVLGNHDCEMPGPPIRKQLVQALQNNGVIYLHNESAKLPGTDFTFLGLGDNWVGEDDVALIDQYQELDNLIVIAHNPDTSLFYKNNKADLTISGHTHAGQVRIPFVYKYVIPCRADFDQGIYNTKYGQVFVSAGVGEVALPMRLGDPPTMDILELY